MSERSEKAQERYRRALHAMQTGVKFMMEYDNSETTPKHLRVGVNAALIDSGSLGQLLIKKNLITEEEYFEMLADVAEEDVKSYTAKLEAITGKKITLI